MGEALLKSGRWSRTWSLAGQNQRLGFSFLACSFVTSFFKNGLAFLELHGSFENLISKQDEDDGFHSRPGLFFH